MREYAELVDEFLDMQGEYFHGRGKWDSHLFMEVEKATNQILDSKTLPYGPPAPDAPVPAKGVSP